MAVFGSGAVGGYFGGRLAQAGEDVAFIARGRHLDAIRRDGLRITSGSADFTVRPGLATDDPAAVGPVDAVLLAVKTWQVVDAAKSMAPLIGPDTFVVPLQNGVEAPGQLRAALGETRALGGLCRIISYVTVPGHIQHAGVAPYVAFGELDGRRSERVERLRAAFAGAEGITAEVPADILAAMWRKFLLIAPWSGLGALTRAPVGVLRSRPETRPLLGRALAEVQAVAQALGVALPAAAVGETLAFIDTLPPEGTTSMQRDIADGRPSELDAQSGAVVRLGEAAGVDVPVHRFAYDCLMPLELRARGQLTFA